jgi:hypothetical protein
MATAARDRLGRMLRGDAQTAFSAELTARRDNLSLEVEGFGHIKFPVTPAMARKLAGLGRPARFGRILGAPAGGRSDLIGGNAVSGSLAS